MTFDQIRGKDLHTVPEKYLGYSVTDSVVTDRLYEALNKRAAGILKPFGSEVDETFISRFGYFNEAINANASIAFAHMEARGVCIDQAAREKAHKQVHAEVERLADELDELSSEFAPTEGLLFALPPSLFKRNNTTHDFVRTASGVPSIKRDKVLVPILKQLARNFGFPLPRTEKKHRSVKAKSTQVSMQANDWKPHAGKHPFIRTYLEFKKTSKLLGDIMHYADSIVYPHYGVAVTTNRTSCSKPNIQQLRKDYGLRPLVVPRPGYVFIRADFSFIELVILAAHCLKKFGFSKLADTIIAGLDPHVYSAALTVGEDYDVKVRVHETAPSAHGVLIGLLIVTDALGTAIFF